MRSNLNIRTLDDYIIRNGRVNQNAQTVTQTVEVTPGQLADFQMNELALNHNNPITFLGEAHYARAQPELDVDVINTIPSGDLLLERMIHNAYRLNENHTNNIPRINSIGVDLNTGALNQEEVLEIVTDTFRINSNELSADDILNLTNINDTTNFDHINGLVNHTMEVGFNALRIATENPNLQNQIQNALAFQHQARIFN